MKCKKCKKIYAVFTSNDDICFKCQPKIYRQIRKTLIADTYEKI